MMAAANPFAFGQFEVYQGKSTYTAVRAEIQNYFRELSQDYDMVCLGSYFLEVARILRPGEYRGGGAAEASLPDPAGYGERSV